MNIAVRYYSKGGNTKKLAEAIAEALEVQALTVDTPVDEDVDVLFLGSAMYAFDVDPRVKQFIDGLDKDRVKKVVGFSTAAVVKSTYDKVKKALDEKGIPMDERQFYSRGEFKFMHKGRPNEQDLNDAKKFAREVTG